MDVCLVLTHRCNLDCVYCYAGEHTARDMDLDVLERAVALLWTDGADEAQLSFFGGEPLLAFGELERAVTLARTEADQLGRTLLVQLTTNGTRVTKDVARRLRAWEAEVTISVDGVREAHDVTRPLASGKSSFDSVHRGLRTLLSEGVSTGALIVVRPETVSLLSQSVSWLWDEGVRRVQAQLDLKANWTDADRRELREELLTVGWELLARALRGDTDCTFIPFEQGMLAEGRDPRCSDRFTDRARRQIVVGTTGHLYPCAPMVGEDRDDGPEAALRVGHLDTGVPPETLHGCAFGGKCACAAYLETGQTHDTGAVASWYARVTFELGRAVAAGLAADRAARERTPASPRRFPWLAAAAGGLALGGAGWIASGIHQRSAVMGAFSINAERVPQMSLEEASHHVRMYTRPFFEACYEEALRQGHAPAGGKVTATLYIGPWRGIATVSVTGEEVTRGLQRCLEDALLERLHSRPFPEGLRDMQVTVQLGRRAGPHVLTHVSGAMRVVPASSDLRRRDFLTPDDVVVTAGNDANQLGIRLCYTQARRRDPGLDIARFNVRITIDSEGRVTRLDLPDRENAEFLANCLESRLRRWRFRKSDEGLTAEFPLILSKKAGR